MATTKRNTKQSGLETPLAEATAQCIMVPEPICVEPSTTLRELAQIFEENGISGCPVVGAHGTVVGVVSRTDLLHRCSQGGGGRPPAYLYESIASESENDDVDPDVIPEALLCVGDIMTEGPVMAAPDTPAIEIARVMFEGRIHRVIIAVGDGKPVGIITSLDLVGIIPGVRR